MRKLALLVIALGPLAGAQAADRLPFAASAPPPAPDYAAMESWAARPERADAADAVPAGDVYGDRQAMAAVDVFYIHPTTYRGPGWNQDVADAATNRSTDESVIARQASVFNACCRVYAPRYRQAGSGALFARDGSGDRAYDLAYTDVRRAFAYYLDHLNAGRPFILAGHSQGSLHLVRLLEEIAGDPALIRRLVAAYAIGIGVSAGHVERSLQPVGVCAAPEQTRCLLSWNSFLAGSDASAFIERSERRFIERYESEDGKALICVNPLAFNHANASGVKAARCDGGVLFVEPVTEEGLEVLPGGNLHMNDIGLFYGALRADAVTRAAAYCAARKRVNTAAVAAGCS